MFFSSFARKPLCICVKQGTKFTVYRTNILTPHIFLRSTTILFLVSSQSKSPSALLHKLKIPCLPSSQLCDFQFREFLVRKLNFQEFEKTNKPCKVQNYSSTMVCFIYLLMFNDKIHLQPLADKWSSVETAT